MADINKLTVLPRPRSAWQAIDAGFTFARAHYVALLLLWLGISLPFVALCTALYWLLDWTQAIIIWWWFKPLYELPLLFYLSKALFSETIPLRTCWKLAFKNFWLLCITYLSYARLSTARSLTFSVVFLEKLPFRKRGTRIQTLKHEKTRHTLLMWVCIHIEIILAYFIFFSVLGLLFTDAFTEIEFEYFLDPGATEQARFWYFLTSVGAVLAAALMAPFYVSAGFIVYINRRMSLEAWDVEHRFRQIQPRSAVSLGAIAAICFLFISPDDAYAENRAQFLPPSDSIPETVKELQLQEGIGGTRFVKRFKLKEGVFDDDEPDEDNDSESSFDLQELVKFIQALVESFQVIIWILAALFVALLLYTISKFRKPNLNVSPLSRNDSASADAISHPLTADLPGDIPAAAEKLLREGNRRQALSILFRGALRAVMKQYELRILRGATEADCQQTIGEVANDQQVSLFNRLLVIWQREAYANQAQDEQHIQKLINDWSTAFNNPQPVQKQGSAQ